MAYEISQFVVLNRQLLRANAQPKTAVRSDIGVAKITCTIFGRTKVRVVRKQDKLRRVWLLFGLVAAASVVVAWQWWMFTQQAEYPVVLPPLSERIKVSEPVFQPEEVSPTATRSSARGGQKTLTETVLGGLMTHRPPPPEPQPAALKQAEPVAAKPVATQPVTSGKPPVPLSASVKNTPLKNKAGLQVPKLSDPIKETQTVSPVAAQPVVPAAATPPAAQPVENKPESIAPLAKPLVKESSPVSLPAGTGQVNKPVDIQLQTADTP